jgi:hypothetical protein
MYSFHCSEFAISKVDQEKAWFHAGGRVPEPIAMFFGLLACPFAHADSFNVI